MGSGFTVARSSNTIKVALHVDLSLSKGYSIFRWESWLGAHTHIEEEAIVNKVQGKGIEHYRQLLSQSFLEIRRVMKDEAWMTVIFHNSSASIWEALQQAISSAGFIVQASQMFDKEHGTFKQFVSNNAVGYDLVLHCRKTVSDPVLMINQPIEEIQQNAIDFIRQSLVASNGEYVVHYLHVTRKDEVNYRRLYSEWLAETLPKGIIGLNFDKFRELVDQTLNNSINE